MPWFSVTFEKEVRIRVKADSLEEAEQAAESEAYKSDPCGFDTDNWDSFTTKIDEPKKPDKDVDFVVKDGELQNTAELEAEEERTKQEAEARRQAGLPVWDEPEPEPPPVDTKTLPLFKEP